LKLFQELNLPVLGAEGNGLTDIEDCILAYFAPHKTIIHSAKLLLLSLNRFSYGGKITHDVNFGFTLELR